MRDRTLHRLPAPDSSQPGSRSPHLPIDCFFRSLAADQREHAICIILSGTGADGTLGLRAVKAELGMAMVQEPPSAKYGGMPSSAMGTGLADYILPASAMPQAVGDLYPRPLLAAAGAGPRKRRSPTRRCSAS